MTALDRENLPWSIDWSIFNTMPPRNPNDDDGEDDEDDDNKPGDDKEPAVIREPDE
jgi:hypothetical protein